MPTRDLFTGRSGQLAVMAEFLVRELNVAIPEVDLGDDIVVVRHEDDQVTRVQVKTANAHEQQSPGQFAAQFSLSERQLESGPPDLVYAFVVRRNDRWEEFIIVRRSVLQRLRVEYGVGSLDSRGAMILRLTFSEDDVKSKSVSFQPFRRRFKPWPPPDQLPEGVVTAGDTP
jgi:hypothetical protein